MKSLSLDLRTMESKNPTKNVIGSSDQRTTTPVTRPPLEGDVDRNANTTSPRELDRIGQYVNQLEREILNFPAKQ